MDGNSETAAVSTGPVRRAVAGLARLVACGWVFVFVAYFLHREGLVNLAWAGLAPSPRAGLFAAVLSNIPGHYRIAWGNVPWGDLGIAATMIALYVSLGLAIIGCLQVYIGPTARMCLALIVGAGAASVVLELMTMAHLLRQWAVIAAWILMLAAAWWMYGRVRARRGDEVSAAEPGWVPPELREQVALEWMEQVILPLRPGFERACAAAAWTLIGIVSLLLLLHGVGQPETYWDSLILYMGYARKMFLQHCFPFKAVGQVGIGLGANYPHLYALLTAQTAAAAGHWSDTFAQLLPPVTGFAATLLVYCTALELTRQRLPAVCVALLFRAVPYGLCYSQFASDYAIAILFTAGFLYAALRTIQDGLAGYRLLMLMIAAFASHINYLMLILWPAAAVAILVAYVRARPSPTGNSTDEDELFVPHRRIDQPGFMRADPEPLLSLLRSGAFWKPALACAAIASPWYLRNLILTGNPVYAFFNSIFPGVRVNPDVMASAEMEWLLNGDGLGTMGRSILHKLAGTWYYFVTGPHHWKLAPVFAGFVMPGFALFAWQFVTMRWRRAGGCGYHDTLRFATVAAFLFAALWFYAYFIADYYLYQIVIVLPLFGVFACFLFDLCHGRASRTALCVLCLVAGFAPGVVMGLMGFKLKHGGTFGNRSFSQVELSALKNLFMDRDTFYAMEYDGDMLMLSRVNKRCAGKTVLTHENRHLLLDERVGIVHLDDWEVQQAYGQPPEQRLAILDKLRIGYYLYVPNEDKHVANSWLGMDELVGMGAFEEIYRTPASGSSVRTHTRYKHIPENMNVLYRRRQADMVTPSRP